MQQKNNTDTIDYAESWVLTSVYEEKKYLDCVMDSCECDLPTAIQIIRNMKLTEICDELKEIKEKILINKEKRF